MQPRPDEASQPRLLDSIARPIAIMPLSRIENTTFAISSFKDLTRYGIEDCFTVQMPKEKRLPNAYSTMQLHIHSLISPVRET
ncbi:hypothetical protein TNCV_4749261 [Trichonephila clavipes]|nr:hypothetical protein TNCV_4749261 [Trichonephila clavipes]